MRRRPPRYPLFPYTTLFRSLTSSSSEFTIGATRWLHYGSAEKATQSVGGLFRNLFRKKVSGAQGASLNIIAPGPPKPDRPALLDRKSTRLNSSHANISYAVF